MTAAPAMSLRLRLFLTILTPLLAVSVALGFWRFAVAQATAEELFDRGLLAAALAIARDVTITEGDALSPATRQLISDAGGGEVFYHVTGPGGIYVTGYAYPPIQPGQSVDSTPQYSMASYRGEPVRVLRMSETHTIGNLTGDTLVTVWQRASDRDAFASALAQRAAALITALMAALAVVVWFGVQRGLRPLADLQDAIEQRSPTDLSRIQRPVPTEVEGVVSTLNRLFGQLETNIQTHRDFISDAAHQLRNPASALLSLAETLPQIRDAEERRAQEQTLIGAARRAALLAEQLLSLERLRYDAPKQAVALDLNQLAEEVCTAFAPEVLSRDLGFRFDRAQGALPVTGDPVLIGEALRNLIDNALRHGGPDLSEIEVRCNRTGQWAELRVRDDGRGLPATSAELAFRRFGQLSASDGSGLGLSIVQEVAQGHGGTAEVEDVAQGTSVLLRLPLAPDG